MYGDLIRPSTPAANTNHSPKAAPTAATLQAMLNDTADLMERVKYADAASRDAAFAQVEAIKELLTA